MVKNVNFDDVAIVLSRLNESRTESEQPEIPLEYDCEAREYYTVLDEVVETISCVAEIFRNLPEYVVKAADIRIKIDYSDNVVGTLVVTGE